MRSPSIVPGFDVDVYLVLDDFGKIGRAYRETDESKADKETLIRNLMRGQYNDPVRIICFNTAGGWSRDVTEDIAREIKARADRNREELSPGLRDFIEYQFSRRLSQPVSSNPSDMQPQLSVKVKHHLPHPHKYSWEIHDDRHCLPVQIGREAFQSYDEANEAGKAALKKFKTQTRA
jgi:hypothetical protein